jgi:hypothetical protein
MPRCYDSTKRGRGWLRNRLVSLGHLAHNHVQYDLKGGLSGGEEKGNQKSRLSRLANPAQRCVLENVRPTPHEVRPHFH